VLHLKICNSGHTSLAWCSQPIIKKNLTQGDAVISAATVFSGNNYDKIALLFKFIGMSFVSRTSFFRLQRHAICPTVDEYWNNMRTVVLHSKQDPIIIAGIVLFACTYYITCTIFY
jgi:hypothetical protein